MTSHMTPIQCVMIVELLRHNNSAIIVVSIALILPCTISEVEYSFHVFAHSVLSSGIRYLVLFISCILFIGCLSVYWRCLLVAIYNWEIGENYLYLQEIFRMIDLFSALNLHSPG